MAVDFVEKKKKQKYLLFFGLGLVAVTAVILYFGYFNAGEELSVPDTTIIAKKNIKIKYEVLENPLIKDLLPFESAPLYEGDLGRENPFVK